MKTLKVMNELMYNIMIIFNIIIHDSTIFFSNNTSLTTTYDCWHNFLSTYDQFVISDHFSQNTCDLICEKGPPLKQLE